MKYDNAKFTGSASILNLKNMSLSVQRRKPLYASASITRFQGKRSLHTNFI